MPAKKTTPKIRVPATTPDGDEGLVFSRGIYYAWYYYGTSRKWAPLDRFNKPQARIARDEFYRKLRAEGATVVSRKSSGRRAATTEDRKQAVAVNPGGDDYITIRKPYRVVVGKKVIAECDTIEQARDARNKHFGINTESKTP